MKLKRRSFLRGLAAAIVGGPAALKVAGATAKPVPAPLIKIIRPLERQESYGVKRAMFDPKLDKEFFCTTSDVLDVPSIWRIETNGRLKMIEGRDFYRKARVY